MHAYSHDGHIGNHNQTSNTFSSDVTNMRQHVLECSIYGDFIFETIIVICIVVMELATLPMLHDIGVSSKVISHSILVSFKVVFCTTNVYECTH